MSDRPDPTAPSPEPLGRQRGGPDVRPSRASRRSGGPVRPVSWGLEDEVVVT